jgi:hypothetical protein
MTIQNENCCNVCDSFPKLRSPTHRLFPIGEGAKER